MGSMDIFRFWGRMFNFLDLGHAGSRGNAAEGARRNENCSERVNNKAGSGQSKKFG